MLAELAQEGSSMKEQIDWEGVKAPEKVVCWPVYKGPRLEVSLGSFSVSRFFGPRTESLFSSSSIDVAVLRNLAAVLSPFTELVASLSLNRTTVYRSFVMMQSYS